MAEKSAIQRIKELDADRANILAQAKEQALAKANQAIEELNALGFNYQLTNGAQKVKGKIAKEGAMIKQGCALPHLRIPDLSAA
jgi:hypothetical protein